MYGEIYNVHVCMCVCASARVCVCVCVYAYGNVVPKVDFIINNDEGGGCGEGGVAGVKGDAVIYIRLYWSSSVHGVKTNQPF